MSKEQETSEESEANAMDSLIDMPFATIDIQDECASKYWKQDSFAYHPGYPWIENKRKHQCSLQMFIDSYFAFVFCRALLSFDTVLSWLRLYN